MHGPHTASHALMTHFLSTKGAPNYKTILIFGTLLTPIHAISSMAIPKLHFLSFFFFCTIFLCLLQYTSSLLNPADHPVGVAVEADEVNMVQTRRVSTRKCDFSVGKWVYDQSYPLYDTNCPYLTTAVTCQKNGRPDSDYEKWKWKPYGCSIPRYLFISIFLLG